MKKDKKPMKTYSAKEFAEIVGVTRRTLLNWEKSNKLKPYKVKSNGYKVYSQKQVDDFLNDCFEEVVDFFIKDEVKQDNKNDKNNQKDKMINLLEKEVEFLKEQLKIKDNQIAEKDEQLKTKDEIIKHEQELRFIADRKIIMIEREQEQGENNQNSEDEQLKKWYEFWK